MACCLLFAVSMKAIDLRRVLFLLAAMPLVASAGCATDEEADDDYVREDDFGTARVGFEMDDDERRRRHLIQSLLQASGLDRAAYRARFGGDPVTDFAPELTPFLDRGWVEETPGLLRLTPEGLAHSDALGPALFSPAVRAAMAAYEAK